MITTIYYNYDYEILREVMITTLYFVESVKSPRGKIRWGRKRKHHHHNHHLFWSNPRNIFTSAYYLDATLWLQRKWRHLWTDQKVVAFSRADFISHCSSKWSWLVGLIEIQQFRKERSLTWLQKRMISDVEKLYRFLVLLRDNVRITKVMRTEYKVRKWER